MVQGLIGNITKLAGGMKPQAAPARQGYYTNMVIEDGDAAYDTVAEVLALLPAAGVKARIWEYTVPAQQAITWGFGTPLTPANQGYIWFCIIDEATDFQVGTVLLSHENHSRHNTIPVAEFNDIATHEATVTSLATARTNNKEHLYPLPEGGNKGSGTPLVGQDSRLVIDYTTITAATTADNMGFVIPATVYD